MPGKRPNKKELAQMKALEEMGKSPSAIARRMGKSHHTVIKYLDSDVFNDLDIRGMVSRIKEREIDDLYLLGAKARRRLHSLLDKDNTKAIETTAIMDRSFQQRRLLEGQVTEIHDYAASTKKIERLKAKLAELEAEEARIIDVTPQEVISET